MEPQLRLVRAESVDVPSIQELVRAAYSPYVERIGREPAPMNADYALAVYRGTVTLAKDGARILGVLVTEPGAESLLIENIAVHPNARGLGVGAALLRQAETEAETLGLSRLELYTNAKMTENLDYYPRRGYLEVDRRTEDGFDRVFFVRTLMKTP